MTADVQVLARIEAPRDWLDRPSGYRKEVCDWMRANGVDPCVVPLPSVVEVVLLDAPAIRRVEYVPGTDRRWRLGPDGDVVTRVVHSLLRVSLPDHLADPTEETKTLRTLVVEADRLEVHAPANGWGTREGAVEAFTRMVADVEAHPLARWDGWL